MLDSLHLSYLKAEFEGGFEAHEISFGPQNTLFDLLQTRTGHTPPVIDSDDLLEDPTTMVSVYCDAIGLPFIPEALSWKPGDRSEVLWYDGNDNIWHSSLRDSDGLKPIPRKQINPEQLPHNLASHYPVFMKHYRALHEKRLQPVRAS